MQSDPVAVKPYKHLYIPASHELFGGHFILSQAFEEHTAVVILMEKSSPVWACVQIHFPELEVEHEPFP
jgi:hypothetical protein